MLKKIINDLDEQFGKLGKADDKDEFAIKNILTEIYMHYHKLESAVRKEISGDDKIRLLRTISENNSLLRNLYLRARQPVPSIAGTEIKANLNGLKSFNAVISNLIK